MTVPQVWQIWTTHSTAGVSLLTWSFYLTGAFIWLLYGFKTHDKPIITSSGLWVIMEGAVVAGLLAFR